MNDGGPFVNNEDYQNSDWASETHKWILEGFKMLQKCLFS